MIPSFFVSLNLEIPFHVVKELKLNTIFFSSSFLDLNYGTGVIW